jgi:uncharacterized membrane protein YfcA
MRTLTRPKTKSLTYLTTTVSYVFFMNTIIWVDHVKNPTPRVIPVVLLFSAGLACAIIGLLTIPTHSKSHIIRAWAIVGICLNAALLFMLVTNFSGAASRIQHKRSDTHPPKFTTYVSLDDFNPKGIIAPSSPALPRQRSGYAGSKS